MSPRVKWGLIIGAVALFLTACVAVILGFCGPLVPLFAGGVAGYLAVNEEKPATKRKAAESGAISGAICGGMGLVGQVIAGLGVLGFMQGTGA